MIHIKTTYKEIGITFYKIGKCSICGKSMKRQKRFTQTINPFNKNKNGYIKSSDEIYAEVRIEGEKWKKEPMIHDMCKGNNK